MRGTRVIVVGAGIVGAACARELAAEGFEVVVVDRHHPGGATTAHGEGNVLVSDKEPGAELRLAQLSLRLWPEAVAEPGHDAVPVEWRRKGGIVVATTEAGAAELTAFAAAQREAGVLAEPLDADALADAEPHVTRDAAGAVHYPDDAQVQPVAAACALLSAALAAGAVLRPRCEVTGALNRGDRIIGVRTSDGELTADAVVDAAGPWAGELSGRLGAPIGIRPRRGEVLVTTPLPPTVFHKVYDADYVGAVGSDTAELQISTVVESTEAGTILLGSSRRRVGFDRGLRPVVLAAIAAGALRLFPGLAGVPVMRVYGGFRPYVPDHLPVIGEDPRLAGLWHATGHEGAGIGLSVGTGRVLRDLLAGRSPEIDARPFAVDRPAVLREECPA
jgi:D-hydroxyproline dehydrogenase subunit beta